ncbi:MAG TPA: hypothetical protein VHZ56_00770, partial [Devosia sp.]|nr:hypothetical protein [Devosia sp.]
LVAELLARGDINDETTLELNRILADWRADRLDPEDAAYVEALHSKLMNVTFEPNEAPPAMPLARLEGLAIEEWRDRALRAESELAQLQEAARDG